MTVKLGIIMKEMDRISLHVYLMETVCHHQIYIYKHMYLSIDYI